MTVHGLHDWLKVIAAVLFLVAAIFAVVGYRRPDDAGARWSLWPAFIASGLICWVLSLLGN